MLFNLHEKNRALCLLVKAMNKPYYKNAISINGLFWQVNEQNSRYLMRWLADCKTQDVTEYKIKKAAPQRSQPESNTI